MGNSSDDEALAQDAPPSPPFPQLTSLDTVGLWSRDPLTVPPRRAAPRRAAPAGGGRHAFSYYSTHKV